MSLITDSSNYTQKDEHIQISPHAALLTRSDIDNAQRDPAAGLGEKLQATQHGLAPSEQTTE